MPSTISSQDNRDELGRACGKYLLATRMANVTEIKRDVLSKKGRYTVIKDNLYAKEVILGDGEMSKRYILCFNPKEAERQRKQRAKVLEILEKELARHPNKNGTAQWALEFLASQRYKRYLAISKSNNIRIYRGKVREARKYDGKWVLETNDDTISMQDAANGYKGLMVIERCFRSLKRTQIKMTPMFHWIPRRIEPHVRICVLTLLIERVAEIACQQPWSQIRRNLQTLQVTEFLTLKHRFFRRNELTPEVSQMLKILDVTAPKNILSVENLR